MKILTHFVHTIKKDAMNKITSGTLLIAEPFLKDPSFARSAVIICKYSKGDGAFGFTLTRFLNVTLDDIVKNTKDLLLPIHHGGPVQTDTLHYLHQYPQHFDDAVHVAGDIYWGGDFEKLKFLIRNNMIDTDKIKFFLGYSGWDAGQLEEEIKEDTWIISKADAKLVFETPAEEVWNTSLTQLGGKYRMMVHFPTDPQLN